jgi:hypothetical protein
MPFGNRLIQIQAGANVLAKKIYQYFLKEDRRRMSNSSLEPGA